MTPPARHFRAPIRGFIGIIEMEGPMDWLFAVSFDTVVMSAITCLMLREVMILALPDEIAGPGGWLIDSDPE